MRRTLSCLEGCKMVRKTANVMPKASAMATAQRKISRASDPGSDSPLLRWIAGRLGCVTCLGLADDVARMAVSLQSCGLDPLGDKFVPDSPYSPDVVRLARVQFHLFS